MAVTNFVPDLWSAKLLVALRKSHVAGNLVNRDYEGEIRREGDSVKITSINDVTIGSYTAHNDITWEDIDDATRSLIIDQAKYFAVELDDIEDAQQKKGGKSALDQAVENASYQLSDTSDAFLLDLMNDAAEATATDLGTVAVHTTGKNLYDSFVDLNTALSTSNVPRTGRFVVVSPAVLGRLVKLDLLISSGDALGAETRTSGFVGRIAGLDVYESNNLPAVTDAAATGGLAIAGHSMATTFAEQILKVKAVDRENRFAMGVKGLHVYGAKVVRPTAVAKVEFDATA